MSDQEKAGRLMTFEEFAPQCVVAADCWLKDHPQDPQCDWNSTYGLIHSLRDCLQRGINQLQRERQESEPLTDRTKYRNYVGNPIWVKTRTGYMWCGIMRFDERIRQFVIESHYNKLTLPAIGDHEIDEVLYATEPKGEHHD